MTHQIAPIVARTRRLGGYLALMPIAMLSLLGPAQPTIAQESNFGSFGLNAKTRAAVVDGTTGGSTSLSAITTNLDRNENQCFGFGDPRPDHILSLEKPIDRLKLLVNSRGTDTTLVIQAPDGSFLCADDFGNGKDAGLETANWQPGKYKLWIGTVRPGQRQAYQLIVQAN
jgi:hypothetical protein